ncbi:hypothetical protein SmJEL517_g04857 [Synchytrium microbalum]|uniref:alpha-1,2-Mannosidase n=1 Tax=Synchytrium microbalum TaxID=1806994 RepID=A0A507BWY3_9FUNG|nr:uncharacterized protein SmJEL517_g04857 [Synchytrium microbalum]TPX31952.1 hypothetical protein SmJEL517_g04857 [Synchytrium microbalum]
MAPAELLEVQIPTDVIHVILSFLQEDHKSLYSSSLVSKEVNECAVPLLYRSVSMNSQAHIQSVTAMLNNGTTYNQLALSHVKELMISCEGTPTEMLPKCINLSSLHWHESLRSHVNLLPIALTTFTAMRLKWDDKAWKALVQQCPNITSLNIELNRDVKAIQYALEHLQLKEFKLETSAEISFPIFNMARSNSTLVKLSMSGMILPTSTLKDSSMDIFPNLESVSFSSVEFGADVFMRLLGSTSRRLRKVYIEDVEGMSPADLSRIVQQSSRFIELLDVFPSNKTIIEARLFELELPKLSSLRCRTIDAARGGFFRFMTERGHQLKSLVLFGPRSPSTPTPECLKIVNTIASTCINLRTLLLYNVRIRLSTVKELLVSATDLRYLFSKLEQDEPDVSLASIVITQQEQFPKSLSVIAIQPYNQTPMQRYSPLPPQHSRPESPSVSAPPGSNQPGIRHSPAPNESMEQPVQLTYNGYVGTTAEALIIIEACRLGRLPIVARRLTDGERLNLIKSGAVFVFNGTASGIKRWTDSLQWTPSRVSGAFLVYSESKSRHGIKSRLAADVKDDGLIKKTIAITTEDNVKYHLVAYHAEADKQTLRVPSDDPLLRDIPVPAQTSRIREREGGPSQSHSQSGSPIEHDRHAFSASEPVTPEYQTTAEASLYSGDNNRLHQYNATNWQSITYDPLTPPTTAPPVERSPHRDLLYPIQLPAQTPRLRYHPYSPTQVGAIMNPSVSLPPNRGLTNNAGPDVDQQQQRRLFFDDWIRNRTLPLPWSSPARSTSSAMVVYGPPALLPSYNPSTSAERLPSINYVMTNRAMPLPNNDSIDQVKEMFYHGWDNYMKYGFPADELNPLTCTGRSRDDSNPNAFNVNDVLAGVSVTLIDTLDTFVVMNDPGNFTRLVNLVISRGPKQLDVDSRVQVFETTIRILGGLLSAHLLTTNPAFPDYRIAGYNNELLALAEELGKKLLPAFDASPTGIPYARVNLMYGVLPWEVNDTCTAGAGTLILEFGILSRLTGNKVFERVAKKALRAIWERRSKLDLWGNSLNIQTGKWIHAMSGIGAGIDSWYEYLLKAYILFGDIEYLDMFETAYAAVLSHMRDTNGFVYKNVNMDNGQLTTTWVDSLAAFFPGLQILYGDIENAKRLHHLYFSLWRRFKSLPERFDWTGRSAIVPHYPLRPELIESTYMLYRATRDPFYQQVGEEIVDDLNSLMRVECGFASLSDVVSKTRADRMESFFLSETLKYLMLLFDDDNVLNRMDSNYVFSTEGHMLVLPYIYTNPSYNVDNDTQPYQPQHIEGRQHERKMTCPTPEPVPPFSFQNQRLKSKRMYPPIPMEKTKAIHRFVGLPEDMDPIVDEAMCNTQVMLSQQPLMILSGQTFDVRVEPPPGVSVPPAKLVRFSYGFATASVAGLHLKIELDIASPDAFIITSVTEPAKPQTSQIIKAGQVIRAPKFGMAFLQHNYSSIVQHPPVVNISLYLEGRQYFALLAAFGRDVAPGEWMDVVLQPLLDAHGVLWDGCAEYKDMDVAGRVPLVLRGQCTFADKATFAQRAGATALLVIARDNRPFTMSGSSNAEIDGSIDIPVAMLGIPFLRHVLSLDIDSVDAIICGPRLNADIECGITIEEEAHLGTLYKADTMIQFSNLPVRNMDVVWGLSGRERRVLKSGRVLANGINGVLDKGQGIGCAGGSVKEGLCCRDLVGLEVGRMGPCKTSYVRHNVRRVRALARMEERGLGPVRSISWMSWLFP